MLFSMRRARSCGDEDGDGDGVDPFTPWRAARMVAVICFARMMMEVYVLFDGYRCVHVVLRSG
jgi:hypothetical protein